VGVVSSSETYCDFLLTTVISEVGIVLLHSCNLAVFDYFYWARFKKRTAYERRHSAQVWNVSKNENYIYMTTHTSKTLKSGCTCICKCKQI
jgi:hypothetical protein